MKNYEKTLPEGYSLAFHINAQDKKTGLTLSLLCLIITALAVVLALIPLGFSVSFGGESAIIAALIFSFGMVAYIILHELTHGAVYKLLTKRRLTFGMSWSCAFCGVPDIFVYRAAAMAALCAPLVLFTLLFAPLCALMFFIDKTVYFAIAVLFAYHLGGCVGDGFMLILFLTKFRDKSTLMRDMGPEQFIYLKTDVNEEK